MVSEEETLKNISKNNYPTTSHFYVKTPKKVTYKFISERKFQKLDFILLLNILWFYFIFRPLHL